MSYQKETSAKGFVIGSLGVIIVVLMVKLSLTPEPGKTQKATKTDTVISGMHYIIWTEPRTGDIYVVNATIDSIKNIMFINQTK